MHHMFIKILNPDRLEGTRTNMQCHKSHIDPAHPNLFHDAGIEMQTSRGCGYRARCLCINRLVS